MMRPALVNVLYPTQATRDARVVELRSEIFALQKAERSGIASANYDGKSVTYADLDSLKRRLSLAQSELLQLSGLDSRLPQAGFATFSRGTFGR